VPDFKQSLIFVGKGLYFIQMAIFL